MFTIYKQEMKNCMKQLIFWSLLVGGMGLLCILLYGGMQDSMEEMAESFANMGAFSDALGMSVLSIGTLVGYFATEIGTIHALGGGMFAASIATVMLSKEEDGHTGEFLFSLPVSRKKIVSAKLLSVISNILLFTIFCGIIYSVGFLFLDDKMQWKEYLYFLSMQGLMNVEIGVICFAVSAGCSKNKLGIGFGIALMCYLFDLMARVIPKLKDFKIIGPYAYANAADIFSTGKLDSGAIVVGCFIMLIGVILSYCIYLRRDLRS